MTDNVDKQPEATLKPPTGFQLHPENINKLGRPKRKTLTELIHDRLDKDPNGWNDLVEIVLTMAKKKDREIIKELWHYTDGMPKQKSEISGPEGGPIPILSGTTNVVSTNDSNKKDTPTK